MYGGNVILSEKKLKRPSHETCDFCEETFSNKYDALKHNASHIIIPLIKLKLQQCKICLFFYSTEEELLGHISTAHFNTVKAENQNIPLKEEEPIYLNGFSHQTLRSNTQFQFETLKERVKQENDLSLHLLNDLTTDCKVAVETLFSPEDIKIITNDCKENIQSLTEDVKIEDDCSIIDLVDSDSNASVNSQDEEVLHNNGLQNYNKFADRCMILDDMLVIRPKSCQTVQNHSEIVSFDVLMKPGVFKCQHCNKTFYNRLKSIKHETTHLSFKIIEPQLCLVCDKYIGGTSENLRRHLQKYHPHSKLHNQKYEKRICEKCKLPYRHYMHHIKYYHRLHCYVCIREFSNMEEKDEHMKEHLYNCTTLQMCSLCMSFYKSKINVKYTMIGVKNVPGERQFCYSCGKLYLEINLVKRHTHKSLVYRNYEKKRSITNEERLKNIQHRLKMMKV